MHRTATLAADLVLVAKRSRGVDDLVLPLGVVARNTIVQTGRSPGPGTVTSSSCVT